ncbi:hypothetical protein [Brachyspira hampsonii]|uniref:Uncharacterized protein n=2 Tax=Brachyspira hampsonii TaxID=1287055 RepID=A0A2U4F3T8_9SPIR|nr:hypothetical protein [Brachyspira hampsonii]EKV58179.1 hypothetical protein A966_01481 [Brachyspira hampsonii 30446]MBW5389545.1 hypothetical protein [Brachyspira hampsonii]
MKRVILVIFITVVLSVSLFAERKNYYCSNEPYTYFIYNGDSLTKAQLDKIMELKKEYQPKISELRKKMYLERNKINSEIYKRNPHELIINNSINLNMEYAKELRKIVNDFLQKYNKIKNKK